MPQYDHTDADLFIYAQREDKGGALARLGHDLKLRADDFTLDVDLHNGEATIQIDAESIEPVDSIIWENREETGELSDGDRREIKQRMAADVFDLDDHPDIEFSGETIESTDDGWHVVGTLEMHGVRETIEFDVERLEDRVHAELTVDHTDFDIEPYTAMLGSLKVDPEVVVEFEGPLPSDL